MTSCSIWIGGKVCSMAYDNVTTLLDFWWSVPQILKNFSLARKAFFIFNVKFSKNLTIVGNKFQSLCLEPSEYLNINAQFLNAKTIIFQLRE